jgi:PhnB protein
MAVNPIPEGFATVTPYLYMKDAARFIEFVKSAFGAVEQGRMPNPDGTVAHAALQIGSSMLMLSEGEPRPSSLFLYVEDTDAQYRRALQAGATSDSEPADMFWGDRFASVTDAWGNSWQIGTHIEDLSEDEMMKRAAAAAPAT